MSKRIAIRAAVPVVVALVALVAGPTGALAQAPKVETPQPGVPEIFTLEGEFVRIAYNNEGYVTLGYRLANASVGEDWMVLQVGLTVRGGVKEQKFKRTAFSLDTPEHNGVQLATQSEYQGAGGDVRALDMRMKMVTRDSIDYWPPEVRQPCALSFFKDMSQGTRGMSFDEVSLSSQRGCIGRIYFKVPGKIQRGQHWLNVKYENSLIRVPFRILTKEEEKLMSKKWKDIKKEHEKAFKK